MDRNSLKAFLIVLCIGYSALCPAQDIQPFTENPAYWQYKGKPVLLLGATDDDNLFQHKEIVSHLDSLAEAGGNYIRNTMSDRDPGNERAFFRNADGKYDLRKWNPVYWQRFEHLLEETQKRDIIVQIEIWDRFDHSRSEWQSDPYNPRNNINYTYREASLDSKYPEHPSRNKQPFFYTVPALDDNKILRSFQEAFVKKLLSISLQYDHVLYCIDNETSGAAEWGAYWARFLREQTGEKQINITEMWDNWDVTTEVHKQTLDHPELYDFVDISQNTQTTGQANWDHAQVVFNYISDSPRPVNSTKIYGNEGTRWGQRGITTEHAIQTFFRNVVGGFASSRFHRPPSGLGLSPLSINCIRTIREIESRVKMWEITPRMDLLKENGKNNAFLSAQEGKYYLLYFTHAGSAKLDLGSADETFKLRWIGLETARWEKKSTIKGGAVVSLECPFEKGGFALLYSR